MSIWEISGRTHKKSVLLFATRKDSSEGHERWERFFCRRPFVLLEFFFYVLALPSQKSLKVKKWIWNLIMPSKVCFWKDERIVVWMRLTEATQKWKVVSRNSCYCVGFITANDKGQLESVRWGTILPSFMGMNWVHYGPHKLHLYRTDLLHAIY